MRELGPQGASQKHPPRDQPLRLLPLAVDEVLVVPCPRGWLFLGNFCPSVFASGPNLNVQGLHIFSGMFFSSCSESLG